MVDASGDGGTARKVEYRAGREPAIVGSGSRYHTFASVRLGSNADIEGGGYRYPFPQPLARSSARFHSSIRRSASSRFIFGSKRFATFHCFAISSRLAHTPVANPAR